ncbi:MAG: DUF4830 domain-containing protein [Oscillospiraceae bacterium]|nr:DUF4830 domain-containing protein [Oscillospiraceae bacterium]
MAKSSHAFTKKRALSLVVTVAAVLVVLILLRSCVQARDDLSTAEGRADFLSSLGWEIDPDSEEYKRVLIPDKLEGVLSDYNAMQLEQGCDLSRHLGERCDQYSYEITNYPNSDQTVLVTLYVQGRRLIAGDIHSTALNGFMHGLAMK